MTDGYILYSETPTGTIARCGPVDNSVLAPGVGDVGQKKIGSLIGIDRKIEVSLKRTKTATENVSVNTTSSILYNLYRSKQDLLFSENRF
jgi:hypothetical protein